jgi:hypothetical protein
MRQSSNTGTFRFELIKQADLPKGLASLKGPLYEFADSFSLQGFSYMDYLNEVRGGAYLQMYCSLLGFAESFRHATPQNSRKLLAKHRGEAITYVARTD